MNYTIFSDTDVSFFFRGFMARALRPWAINRRDKKGLYSKVNYCFRQNVQEDYAEGNPAYVIPESNRNSTVVNPVTYDTVENSTKKGKREVVEENPTVSYAAVDKYTKKKMDKVHV